MSNYAYYNPDDDNSPLPNTQNFPSYQHEQPNVPDDSKYIEHENVPLINPTPLNTSINNEPSGNFNDDNEPARLYTKPRSIYAAKKKKKEKSKIIPNRNYHNNNFNRRSSNNENCNNFCQMTTVIVVANIIFHLVPIFGPGLLFCVNLGMIFAMDRDKLMGKELGNLYLMIGIFFTIISCCLCIPECILGTYLFCTVFTSDKHEVWQCVGDIFDIFAAIADGLSDL